MPPAAFTSDLAAAHALLQDVLDVSPMGMALCCPLYAADSSATLIDFAYEYLNPAAQDLLQLPARPAETLLARPPAATNGTLAFCREVFESGVAGSYTAHYPHTEPAAHLQLSARRSGNRLVVSLARQDLCSADSAPPAPTEELGPRVSLAHLLEQAPVALAVFRGPRHLIEMANPAICAIWGHPVAHCLHKPLAEVLPEAAEPGFEQYLDEVLATGSPYVAHELPLGIDQPGHRDTVYWDVVYQPLREADGRVSGVAVMGINVSEQVHTHQRVQHLNKALERANTELQANNAALAATNVQLQGTQLQFAQLNEELEIRVQTRTKTARAARTAVEHQRARLERLIQEAPVAICMLDGPELVFELVNPGYQQLFPGRALVGKPVLEALPELVDQPVPQLLRGVYETGVTFEGREVLMQFARPTDGQLETRFFDFIYQARYDAMGQIDGLVVSAFEVTEPVRARQQVERLNQELEARVAERTQEAQAARAEAEHQREELQRIFEQAPVAISICRGPDLVVELANLSMQELWGKLPAQTLGQPLFEAVPEARQQGLEAMFTEVLQTGSPIMAHERPVRLHRHGHWETPYIDFIYCPLRDEQKHITGVIAVATEVTAQVQARQQMQQLNQELEARVSERTQQLEVALREAEQQRLHVTEQQRLLSQILGQVPAAIATLSGPQHRYSFFNTQYQLLTGGRPRLGHTVAGIFPEVVPKGFVALLDQVYATGQPFVGTEMPVRLYDAATGQAGPRHVDLVFQPLLDERGQTHGMLAFVLDVTDKVVARQQVQHLNEALQTTNERLRRTNADLDTFVYAASHDLKAPITNIEGLLDALREQLPLEAQEAGLVPRLLEMMQGAVERFQLTIAQLTDVSRLQNLLDQPEEDVDLAAVVEGVRLDLAPLLAAESAQLTVDIAACPTIYFSVKNLRSLLYNLLSNAIKYRALTRSPQVHLRCTCTPTQTILEVQDNGLGLSEVQQTKLFTMFKRLHDHVDGSGVGLYMVKKMVENAGGTISVQSQLDVGSTFRVLLPRALGS